MIQLIFAVALAPVLLAQSMSDVAPRHGKEILNWCANYPDNPNASLCRLYVGGAHHLLEEDGDFFGKRACPPKDISDQQIAAVSRAWVQKVEERQQLGAKQIVSNALEARYPCKK